MIAHLHLILASDCDDQDEIYLGIWTGFYEVNSFLWNDRVDHGLILRTHLCRIIGILSPDSVPLACGPHYVINQA